MDLLWLAGMLLWGAACVIAHDFILVPYGIPMQDWHVGVMIGGGVITFIWPWWGTWLFWWAVGMGLFATLAYVLDSSMDAASLRETGWSSILFVGGWLAIMWPVLWSWFLRLVPDREIEQRQRDRFGPR